MNSKRAWSLVRQVMSTLLLILSAKASAITSPYAYDVNRAVLNASRLLAPQSQVLIQNGGFLGKSNEFFYVPDVGERWMTFAAKGNNQRSELRQVKEWLTSDNKTLNKMIGELIVLEPMKSGLNNITFMQVYSDELQRALIRLEWARNINGHENAYWAIVKTDACEKCQNYQRILLTPYSSKPIKFEIRITNNKMTVKVNSLANASLKNYNISYWGELDSHFRAGAVNQGDGNSQVQFKKVKYYSQSY